MADANSCVSEETSTETTVHVDLAGVRPENVTIDVDDDFIQIFAPIEDDMLLDDEEVHTSGYVYSAIPLPEGSDVDGLWAEVAHGHLDIVIPKMG